MQVEMNLYSSVNSFTTMAPVTDYFDADLSASCKKIPQDSDRPEVNDLTVGYIFVFHLYSKFIHRGYQVPTMLETSR